MKITDRSALDGILRAAPVLYLSLNADPAPYVVPVCFGVEGDRLYVHGATTGRKIDLLRANPFVGFSACIEVSIRAGADACSFSAKGMSVAGTGRAQILEDEEERMRGLNAIMRHYQPADGAAPVYRPESLARTCVIAIHIATLQGKRTGGPPESPPGSR